MISLTGEEGDVTGAPTAALGASKALFSFFLALCSLGLGTYALSLVTSEVAHLSTSRPAASIIYEHDSSVVVTAFGDYRDWVLLVNAGTITDCIEI